MLRVFCGLALLLCFAAAVPALAAPPAKPTPFGVAAHDNVTIEWWYVNAHVTTEKGRHLALIGSFFRFGNGRNFLNPLQAQPRAHYLIYAVTDLDKKMQRSYSLADHNMVSLLQTAAPLLAASNPHDKGAQALLAALQKGTLPVGHQEIAGNASVVSKPFHIAYGTENSLAATNSTNTAYALNLDAGQSDKIHLTFSSQKRPMAVGGKGETGLRRANDMYYFSLTRCQVGGTIDTGAGPEKIVGGQGWFDHQWGNSWVAQNNGWDWWGVQLDDGTDILFFRQRDLATGKVFFPLATFMDKDGNQSVTRKIVFQPDPHSLWKSPKTGVTYPLAWRVTFPEKHLSLNINAVVRNQEMQILGPGGGIWEGLCSVKSLQASFDAQGRYDGGFVIGGVEGVAYMELVGYNSPAVKARVGKGR